MSLPPSRYDYACQICQTSFPIETYGDAACPKCGTKYIYDEGQAIDLSPEQAAAIRDFPAVVAERDSLRSEIGSPPPGSHPDEAKPRAATWHQERASWVAEVARLRAENEDLRTTLRRGRLI